MLNQTEIGDYVEQDEELATIETDKVRHHLTQFGKGYPLLNLIFMCR